MNPLDEKFLQYHIVEYLVENNPLYVERKSSDFDLNAMCDREELLCFLRAQTNDWGRVCRKFSSEQDALEAVIKRYNERLGNESIIHLLNGKADKEFKIKGVPLKLVQYRPQMVTGDNDEFVQLYRQNRFAVVKEFRYSNAPKDEKNRIDLVFLINGLPIMTCELKNELSSTHWNYLEAIRQYKKDRNDPQNRFLKTCLVHFAVDNNYDKTSGTVSFFYNWGHHWINDGYTPGQGESPKAYRFISNDDMMGTSVYQSVQAFAGNRLTAGFDWFRYGGKAWNKFISGDNAGNKTQLVDKHEDEVAGYLDARQDVWAWLTLNAGVRIDHHSRVGTEWVPQFGMSFHLPGDIEIKASASKGFRYPNLREMYMFPPQNPDLKPASMWNYELAYSQSLLDSRLRYGINLFYLKAKNIIQTLPNPNGSGRLNQNSGALENSGIEAQIAYRINRNWSADANYSFLHMATPVIAAPEHKLYGGASFSKGRLTASTGLQYINGLYTAVGSNESQENFLLWNVRASFRVMGALSIWARGENLLAQKYEINAGYPMPRATVIGGIDISF